MFSTDLLTEAMKMTKSTESLQSMELQQQYHIRQKDIVLLKQKQAEAQAAQQKTSQHDSHSTVRWSKDFPHGVPSEDLLDMVDDGSMALRTIHECDSLLAFLNNRHSMDYKSLHEVKPAKKRLIKDDSQIIEELRIHNDALRRHILDLLHDRDVAESDLQYYKQENQRQRERIQELENTNRSNMTQSTSMDSDLEYQMPAALKMNLDDLASMDLPPLEMPKFDFDGLTIGGDQSTDNTTATSD